MPNPFIPRPENRLVLLASAGFQETRATWHKFVETRRSTGGYEFVFECMESGARRRYGLQTAFGS